MKSLPQVVMDKEQESIIYKKIDEYFQDVLFAFIGEVLDLKRVENDSDLIANAVKVGKIEYADGVFKAKGNLSNKLSKEFERIGGRYSRASGGYRLSLKDMPINIQQAIAQVRMANQDKIARIQAYLGDLQANMDYVGNNIDFGQQVEKIGDNLDKQFKRSMSKINVIPAELTSYQLAEIAKNYTYNLNYYINKWTQKEIITMREDLQKMTLAGYRAESLEDYFIKRKGIARRKAKFLARQETKLLVAEYRKNRFKQEGVTKYRWSTILDGRERKLHKELNGRIFSWDNPPIIDERTGERGNPGEAYNCRCKAIPVIDDDWWGKTAS